MTHKRVVSPAFKRIAGGAVAEDTPLPEPAPVWNEQLGPEPPPDDGPVPGTAEDFAIRWHGEIAVAGSRLWFVHRTIPQVGVGLLSGQWGTYKTFIALDLAAAAMSGTEILGSEIDRIGGTLLYAAEGESEVVVRFQASIENRCPQFKERAPFAWITPEEMTLNLLDPDSVAKFIARAKYVDAEMQRRFGMPLALIVVDTVVATAGYKKTGDESDTVLGARLMKEGLGEIARRTKTFALGVDHFGKTAETGTRGASSKEDNADVVLAALGERSIAGIVTNPRLAVRKTRGGVAGREYPFAVRIVDTGTKDAKERTETTLVIDWAVAPQPSVKAGRQWPKSLRVLHGIMTNILLDAGTEQRPFIDGPLVRTVDRELVRAEFYKQHATDGDTEKQKQNSRRQAFNRAVKEAQAKGLICIREIGSVLHMWLAT
jgi:hypothetical protein